MNILYFEFYFEIDCKVFLRNIFVYNDVYIQVIFVKKEYVDVQYFFCRDQGKFKEVGNLL